MARRRDITITEFLVEVRESGVRWNGLDAFLIWLLHKKPEGGFAAHARAINRLGMPPRRPRRSK